VSSRWKGSLEKWKHTPARRRIALLRQNYNVTVEGSSALSPFKSLSAKLGVLRGDAEFVVGITGEWDKPKINGGVTLVNGAIGLKEYPAYRITNLAGYLYMDNDRVVLQSLTGGLGGGDIALSGVLYLKKFAFSRFMSRQAEQYHCVSFQ